MLSTVVPFLPGRNGHVGDDLGVLGGEFLPLVDGVVLVYASETLVLNIQIAINSTLGIHRPEA